MPAISVFVDEFYDNFDYDIIGPTARLNIARVLSAQGFRQLSGRVFEGPQGRIEFPHSNRTLASDPGFELEQVLERGVALPFATPTQVVLCTFRREGPELSSERIGNLIELVEKQPANLDKVRDWLKRTDAAPFFDTAYTALDRAQEDGCQQRKGRKFR